MVTFAAATKTTSTVPSRAPAQRRVSHFVAITCSDPSDSCDLYIADRRTHAQLVSPSRDPIGYQAGVGLTVYCRSTPNVFVDTSGFQSAYPPGSQWCSPRLVDGSPKSASNRFIVRSQTQIIGMDVSRLRVDGRIFATNAGWDALGCWVTGYAIEWLLLAVRTDSFSIYPSGKIICTESKQRCLASYATNNQDSLGDGLSGLRISGKSDYAGWRARHDNDRLFVRRCDAFNSNIWSRCRSV